MRWQRKKLKDLKKQLLIVSQEKMQQEFHAVFSFDQIFMQFCSIS